MSQSNRKIQPQPLSLLSMLVEECMLMQDGKGFMFPTIYQMCGGIPCKGCFWFKDGTCPSYQKLVGAQDQDFSATGIADGVIGMSALMISLSHTLKCPLDLIAIGLVRVTTDNPLQPLRGSDLWDKIHKLYPDENGFDLDLKSLTTAIYKTLESLV